MTKKDEGIDYDSLASTDELERLDDATDEETLDVASVSEAGRGEEILEFGEVMDKIKSDDKGKFDIRCSLQDIEFKAERFIRSDGRNLNCFLKLNRPDMFGDSKIDRLEFDSAESAFRQLNGLVHGPGHNWLQKECPATMAMKIIELKKKAAGDVPIILRCRMAGTGPGQKKNSEHPYVRGILKQSYSVYDNTEFIRDITPFASRLGLNVQSVNITDHQFQARLVDSTNRLALSKGADNGDEAFAGICLTNSETGNGTITGEYLVYRLVCSNGLIGLVDGENVFNQTHNNFDLDKFHEKLSVGFGNLMNKSQMLSQRFALMRYINVPDPFVKAKEVYTLCNVPQAHRNMVMDVLDETYSQTPFFRTMFSVVNAVTDASQRIAAPAARARMDAAAGRIVNHEWKSHKAELAAHV